VNVVDNVDPVISNCPVNLVAYSNPAICGSIVSWTAPIGTDNCALSTLMSSHNIGDTFPVGTTLVTYTATDIYGNTSTCSFNVNVTDTLVPAITGCPVDTTVNSDAGICGAEVTWTTPLAAAGCSPTTITSSHNSGDLFPIGVSTVTYYITNANGDMDSCSFTVTVVDNTAPQITACPPSVTVSTDENSCDALVGWVTPIGLDNCSGVTLTSDFNSGDLFSIGTTTVTYIATDEGGLSATCSFTVTVQDRIAPVFQTCPSDMTVNGLSDTCGAYVSWTQPLVVDNCSMDTVISSHSSGSFFPVGSTTVTYTALDSAGMMSTCTFVVTVSNNNPNCESEISPLDPIVIPQAFTPDGDGINDVFVIDGIEQYPNSELVIFNRWGAEVFRTTGYMNDWGGISLSDINLGSNELPTSTYYYVLDTNDDSIGVLKGFVYLQR